jgi:hypothetical protein
LASTTHRHGCAWGASKSVPLSAAVTTTSPQVQHTRDPSRARCLVVGFMWRQ